MHLFWPSLYSDALEILGLKPSIHFSCSRMAWAHSGVDWLLVVLIRCLRLYMLTADQMGLSWLVKVEKKVVWLRLNTSLQLWLIFDWCLIKHIKWPNTFLIGACFAWRWNELKIMMSSCNEKFRLHWSTEQVSNDSISLRWLVIAPRRDG